MLERFKKLLIFTRIINLGLVFQEKLNKILSIIVTDEEKN